MEPRREDLLSALKDAEDFISVTLSSERLSNKAEQQRQQLEIRLKSLTKRSDTVIHENNHLPPLPTTTVPETTQDDEEEDFYDDVREDEVEQAQNSGGPVSTMQLEGVSQESKDDGPCENYEDMAAADKTPKDNEEIYDDTVPEEQNYDEASIHDVEITEDTDYEIAEPTNQIPKSDENEVEDMYDGVEEHIDENKKPLDSSVQTRDRSVTQELESLTKPIKPEDVEEVILTGYLYKQRKKGIYIGSKWQKRYCVLRSFVMYYYTGHNSPSQKGSVILPGYRVTLHKTTKTNKAFVLTREQDRSYIFMAESKEDVVKWMNAIQMASNTSNITNRQSEILNKLRIIPDGDGDTTSLSETTPEVGEIYDDVIQGEQDTASSCKEDIDYEIPSASDAPDTQQEGTTDLYEAPVEETQPESPPPSLYPKPQPIPSDTVEICDEFYEMPEDGISVSSAPPQRPTEPARPQRPPSEPERPQRPPSEPERPQRPPSEPERPQRPPSEPARPQRPPTEPERPQRPPSEPERPQRPPSEPAIPKRPPSEIPYVTEEDEDFYDDVGVSGMQESVTTVTIAVDSKPLIPERNKPDALLNETKPSPPLTPRPRTSAKIPLPPTPKEAETPKPIIPTRRTPQEVQRKEPDIPVQEPSEDFPPPPPLETIAESKGPPPPEEEPEKQVTNYSCIYQALWDCEPDAEDELGFKRGDLIYIYEKPHCDWWIGSKYKPQGYQTRLIPRNFLTEAFYM